MRTSRYIATAIALLMLYSAIPLASYAVPAGVIPSGANSPVSLNGPLLDAIKFTVISSDSTLYSSLSSGTVQGPEWYFSTGSFFQAASNPNLYANSTTTYSFYGYSFNMIRPITNDTHFRQAIQYLMDYGTLQSVVLSGVAGSAQPDLFLCTAYPTVCDPSAYSQYSYSLTKAVAQLKLSGLTWTNSSDALSSYKWYYPSTAGPLAGHLFQPNLWYRIDDPLRTQGALRLVYSAEQIGLTFNAQGTAHASSVVYRPSLTAVISGGTYNPTTGYNNPPVFNYSRAFTTDTWDMYTFGWITSPLFTWPYSFFNSQFVTVTANFDNFYNRSMDYWTNKLNYATTMNDAVNAAKQVAVVFSQQLPYVQLFYTNQLYAVYLNGWAGYVDYASTGPMTSYGAYYSFLNLHPAGQATGGTFNYAVHSTADISGLNPIYNTNWVWQVDLWSEIYDSVLAFSPYQPTTALAYLPWEGPYTVASFNGNTGTGAGWFDFQTSGAETAQPIVGGQVITFNLYHNMTFTDHVPVTAYDLNYSMFLTNLAGSLPDNISPFTGLLGGPTGLIATYIPPNNPYQIQVYINSSSIWNIANLPVPIYPQHIFKYFSADTISGGTVAIDTTQNLQAATSCSGCNTYWAPGISYSNVPTWMKYLPNLAVSNGPFYLKSFDSTTGSGELDKNTNYYRAAWWAGAPSVAKGTNFAFSANINEFIFNAGGSSLGGVASGSTGYAPVTNATGTVTLWKGGQQVGSPIALTAGTGGAYSASIPTGSLSAGTYEVIVNATYGFLGLQRTWWQASGLTVTTGGQTTTTTSTTTTTHPPTGTTTTSTTSQQTSTTTTTTDYTPYIYGGIIVVIIIIIAVALARRRGGGGT